MPPKSVKTIGDLIFYQYAKLMARKAKYRNYWAGVIATMKALRDGEIRMSDTIREWTVEQEQEGPKRCVFCGNTGELEKDHLIPKSLGGSDSADNMVPACKSCNAGRGNRGIYEWVGLDHKDDLHRVVVGKYLKELRQLHESLGTMGIGEETLSSLCARCRAKPVCMANGREAELTCLCLESVLEPSE